MGLKSAIETALLQNLTPTKDENFKISEEGGESQIVRCKHNGAL